MAGLNPIFGRYFNDGDWMIHWKYLLSVPDIAGNLAPDPPAAAIKKHGESFLPLPLDTDSLPQLIGKSNERERTKYEPLSGEKWDFLYSAQPSTHIASNDQEIKTKSKANDLKRSQFKDVIPAKLKSEKHYRNKADHLARKEDYKLGTERIINELGAKCFAFGKKCKGGLELDHINGRTWDSRKYTYAQRLAILQQEHREGDILRVACVYHNRSRGGNEQKGKANYQKYKPKTNRNYENVRIKNI